MADYGCASRAFLANTYPLSGRSILTCRACCSEGCQEHYLTTPNPQVCCWCRKLEAEGAIQDPWARLAHAAALTAAGDADAAAAVLATALQAFHIADKSEVHLLLH